jgi:tripartite-type tricarboxylate transporter receptor subunit TctC
VRIVVGFPAGLTPDIVARLVGQALSERLGQQVIIENRPGASSNIGTELVVRAPPDGYTLLLAASTNAINATLFERLNFDFIRDIAPLASIARAPLVVVVNPSFPAKSVPDLIAYAKANPGKINVASLGSGTTPHLAGELFKMRTGVEWVWVQYRGNFMPDLISGQIQATFSVIPASLENIRAGKLHAVAVTSATRLEVLPNIAPVDEFVPGYEASSWFGLGAPKGTSSETIEKLEKNIKAVLADPNMQARLIGLGLQPMSVTSAEFGKFIADETEKWGKVIRAANIKAD